MIDKIQILRDYLRHKANDLVHPSREFRKYINIYKETLSDKKIIQPSKIFNSDELYN